MDKSQIIIIVVVVIFCLCLAITAYSVHRWIKKQIAIKKAHAIKSLEIATENNDNSVDENGGVNASPDIYKLN